MAEIEEELHITDTMDEDVEEWVIKLEPQDEDDTIQFESEPETMPGTSSELLTNQFTENANNQHTVYAPTSMSVPTASLNSFIIQPQIVASYSVAPENASTSTGDTDNNTMSRETTLPGVSDAQSGAPTEDDFEKMILPETSNVRGTAKKRLRNDVGDRLLSTPKHCGVKGCGTITVIKDPYDVAVFKLPFNVYRRTAWLQQIGRMDLLNKPSNSIHICEKHFDKREIMMTIKGKVLNKTAIPTLYLPKGPDVSDVGVQSINMTFENCSQTDPINMATKAIQTNFDDLLGYQNDEIKKHIAQCKRRLKRLENGAHNTQKDAFNKWCDRFLPDHLAEIVKGQATLKSGNKGNRYDTACKSFSLNWFYSSKQAYNLLSKNFCLLHKSSLKRMDVPISTEYNEDIMTALKMKVSLMSEREKYCSVIVDLMKIRASLGYITKKDRIIGLHDVNGCQSKEPAQYAVVIIARGLLDNWSQPIAFALLSETKRHSQVSQWIDMYLTKLLDIGLKIKTYVPTFTSNLLNEVELRQISVNRPYFLVNGKKIYYIFDVPDLLKQLRDSFLDHTFHFQNVNGGGTASITHVKDLLQHDLNKNPQRLVPKLTLRHTQPRTVDTHVRYAAQLFSRSVATALEMYVDFGVVEDATAKDTVDFLLLMNDLFDILNSSSIHGKLFKKAFCGDKDQVDLLQKSLAFFGSLKILKLRKAGPPRKKRSEGFQNFSEGFQITIKSILLLFEELKQEGHDSLFTRHLHLEVSKKFFKATKTKIEMVVVPSSKIFIGLFRGLFLTHILKPLKHKTCSRDLSKFLVKLNETEDKEQQDYTGQKEYFVNTSQGILQSVSDTVAIFSGMKVSAENNIADVCKILLKGCKHHQICEKLKIFADSFNNAHDSSENNELPTQTSETISPVYFVSVVEKMEKNFMEAFDAIESNSNVGLAAYEKIKDLEFAPPCPCFPTKCFQALFIRLRIFMIVNYNSDVYRQNNFNGLDLVVPKLQSNYS